MNLSINQKELLQRIQDGLIKGDIKTIAHTTGLTREYVSKVLSPFSGTYNEIIVKEAVSLIAIRNQNTQNHLNQLTATLC